MSSASQSQNMDSTSTSKSPRRQLVFGVRDEDCGTDEDCEYVHDSTVLKDINVIHSRLPIEMIPQLGYEFDTEEDAWQYYLKYAKQVGFGVKRKTSYKDKNGDLLDRTFTCCAEGKRKPDKRDVNVKKHRAETRFGCLASMRISRKHSQKFRITSFVGEHNHYLSSPCKTHMISCHRVISDNQAAEIEIASSVGIAPKAAHDFMAVQAGGKDVLGFGAVDYKNHLRNKRTRYVQDGDTGGVLEYLRGMQVKDPNFFYAIQLDTRDMITNIFWADAKMKGDYAHFGDVVCFDTTYRKNNEGRPIAIFVGVNHHKQSTVFGAALLYDETAESFGWLFDTFSKAMGGVKPKTILTDQDIAMSKALAVVWPETYHRLCVWHIYQNALSHLSHVFGEFNDFSKDFQTCIYEYEDEEDFFEAWDSLLDKYNLQDNAWLKRLFELREKWALVYGRFTFCADMSTTQRSESMNSMLKNYVSYKNKFLEFFTHFDRLIADRRYSELTADFKSNISVPYLPFPCELLKHSSRVYTPVVHDWFAAEFRKSMDASCVDCGELGTARKYIVTPYRKKFHHTVMHDEVAGTFTCSCRKFDFAGILCSHVLKLFSMKGIVRIPEKYILKRWTRKAKTHVEVDDGVVHVNGEDQDAVYTRRYKDLCHLYVELATKAAETEDTYLCARRVLLETVAKVDESLLVQGVNEKEKEPETEPTKESCLDPQVQENSSVNIKGIKTKKKTTSGVRLKGPVEKNMKKMRKKHMGKRKNSMPMASSPMICSSTPSGSSAIPIQASEEIPHPWCVQPGYIPSNSHANIQQLAAMQQIPPQFCVPYMIDPSQLQAYWATQSSQVHVSQRANGSNIGICRCQYPCAAGMYCRSSGRML